MSPLIVLECGQPYDAVVTEDSPYRPISETIYGFDDNGNQNLVVAPSGARTTSVWGYENQVEIVVLPSGARGTAAYNAENRRTRLQS